MMLIFGSSNRIWHHWSGKYPGSVGILIGPSYEKKVPVDSHMPFHLDNDAFTCWRDGRPWDCQAWRKMLKWIKSTGLVPRWAAVPDVVTNREATMDNWDLYVDEIRELGWPAAFCVQDDMTPNDVPPSADLIFVGGSTDWKWNSMAMWTSNFQRVHAARVNAIDKIELCEELGCESVDGTGWFRDPSRQDKLPAIKRFIENHWGGRTSSTFLSADTSLAQTPSPCTPLPPQATDASDGGHK